MAPGSEWFRCARRAGDMWTGLRRTDAPGPQPGEDDRASESEAVAQRARLLRHTMGAARDGDGHLDDPESASERLDQELGGVELLLPELERLEDLGAHRAVAVRAVGDLGAGQERDE